MANRRGHLIFSTCGSIVEAKGSQFFTISDILIALITHSDA